jgi:thermostable 8-oxoguanine DNA glycosylase
VIAYDKNLLITDENLVNFQRTDEELQIYVLYCGFSVQRSRSRAAAAMADILNAGEGNLPFDRISSLIESQQLRGTLEATRIGGFDRLEKFLRSISNADLDLKCCSLADLRAIHGLGPAKARFFLLNTRPDARVAVLDRHILAELRALGHKVPEKPPQSEREYQRIEALFLAEADHVGEHPARFNLRTWRQRALPDQPQQQMLSQTRRCG